jgi:hypothetical protein
VIGPRGHPPLILLHSLSLASVVISTARGTCDTTPAPISNTDWDAMIASQEYHPRSLPEDWTRVDEVLTPAVPYNDPLAGFGRPPKKLTARDKAQSNQPFYAKHRKRENYRRR